MKLEDLERYSDAWNEHDIEKVMSYMTQDCVFETGGGSETYGTRHEGYQTVREKFIEVWTDIPDVHFEGLVHFVSGDNGCSEWTFRGTHTSGAKLEMDGCDLFTFEAGKIKSKRSYLKNRG